MASWLLLKTPYLWRLCRTAFGYGVFGAGALLLAFVALPIGRLAGRERADRELRAQRVIHRGCRLYLQLVRALGVMRVRVAGAERLADPHLVVANHPTLVDVLVICSLMPQADCIVNVDRAENFFLRQLVAACGYVPNDAGSRVVEAAVGRLREGRSLIVFPEGTRSPPGGLGHLRRGAAHVALADGRELLPVVIRCDPPTLAKGQKWYDLPDRPFELTVQVGEPIASRPLRESGVAAPLAARRLTAELREIFEKGLNRGDVGSA
jgi:1-acyl-sn-glycerol-3-phosphate acyltransferase